MSAYVPLPGLIYVGFNQDDREQFDRINLPCHVSEFESGRIVHAKTLASGAITVIFQFWEETAS